ncbi:MAG: PleD family two-component system response regulator [Planctomycetaceae bacterium]
MPTTRKRIGKSTNSGCRVSERTHRILCIDDDDDLTRIIKARLQRFPVEVVRASNGKEGLQLTRSQRPSIIITDLQMQRGDGEYLLRRLKSRPSTASIPVLVISGITDPQRRAQAQLMGASAVLSKPIRFEILVEEISRHLELNPSMPEPTPTHIRLDNKPLRIDGGHATPRRKLNGRSEPW